MINDIEILTFRRVCSIFLYSILGRDSFCTNYCISAVCHCWVVLLLRPRLPWIAAFSSSVLLAPVSLVFLMTTPGQLSALRSPSRWLRWLWIKHSGPTAADDIISDCENFTLDLNQIGLCACPLFLQTLGPWPLTFDLWPLDHWAGVQLVSSDSSVPGSGVAWH